MWADDQKTRKKALGPKGRFHRSTLCGAYSSEASLKKAKRLKEGCTTHLKRGMLGKVRHGDTRALADEMRSVFRTGDCSYTVEQAWDNWLSLCDKWGKDYLSIRRIKDDASYKAYFTYLNYSPHIQSMIYTTNWIERL